MYTYQLRVKKIYFHDEDTDFYIFAGKDLNDDAAKDRKVKGNFFTPIKSGVELEVKGEWESSKYGPTLVCKKSKVMMASNEGVKKYLANNVKSIGKVTAGKIVNAWGNNTADVLDNEPERIEELDFLSAKQKKALLNEWSQARSYRRVATKLLGLGLPKYVIKKIFNKYGDETLEIVKQNPYALTEIRGVGFSTVDELALKAGLARDSEERIRGFVLETLSSVTYGQGHLYLTPKEIFKRLNKMPQRQNLALFGRRISSKEIDEQIELLDMAGAVVKERNEVYLKEFHQAEQRSAELLASFMGDQDLEVDTDAFIEEYESTYKITFSDEQAEAIHALNNEKILLLTGLPGTGKCVVPDTLVCGPWGFSPIGDFLPEDLPVDETEDLEVDLDTSEGIRKSAYVYNGGMTDTVKVTTRAGYTIEGTPEHPVRVVKDGEIVWKNLGEIQDSDAVVLVRGGSSYSFGQDLLNSSGVKSAHFNENDYDFPHQMTPDLARIMGYFTSEGSVVDSNTWTITAHDPQIQKYLVDTFDAIFGYEPALHFDSRYGGCVGIRIHSTQIIRWFRSQGVCPEYAKDKTIPNSILKGSKSSVSAYLSALFEGDGSVSTSRFVVEYGTASEKLAYEVQTLLLAFGVVSSRSQRSNGHWRLFVAGEDYDAFRSEIGFHYTLLPERLCESNTNKHLIYGIQPLIAELKDEVSPSKGADYNLFYRAATGRRTPSRDKVSRLLEFQKEPNELTHKVQTLMRDDFFYDPVSEIGYGHSQVVDFGVPSNHEFLSSGFISHNTTVTKALVRLFKRADKKFQLMSPTGIAAKKLSTVVGQEASTIHRLLGYQGGDSQWKYNENNKFPIDAVIVDECSMVDQQLFVNLLSALEEDTTLVFVGDHAQLPSVGPGNVLHELINSGEIKQINLTKIFRQEQASDIVVNAHKINSGKEPDLGDPSDPQVDVKFIPADTPSKILHGIREVVQRLWDKDNDRTFQVLSPTYKSPIGVDSLNSEIKEMLNPLEGNKQEVYLGANSFREDDRIMVVENDYSIDTYNGEIGKVVRVNRANKELRVKIFDEPLDKMHDIPYDKAKTLLAPAYSITIHKCLHPDTLVETEDGLVRIEDISDTGVIATPSGPLDYKNKVHNTVNEALELSCDMGYGLTVTPDHGLDVWDGDSYVRKEAKDFSEGEFLRFKLGTTLDPNPPRLPEPTAGGVREVVYSVPEEMTEDIAELLGLLVADGCLYSRGFRLKKRHSDVVERFGELCKQIFGCDPKKSENYQDENATGLEVNSTFLARWLASLGGLSSNSKAIPSVILRSPLFMQKAFLRGLFADGTVSWKNNRLDHIAFTQKGSEITRTVQIMLLRMGIISSRSNSPSKGDLETLALYGDHARLFRDEIGFVSEFKQSRLVQSSIGKSRHDVVPFSKGEIRSLWDNHHDVFPNVYAKQKALQRGYLSRAVVLVMRNKLADKGVILPWLNERLSWHHVRVSSIEKTFCESYCVEVPDGHQFLQNGCSGWNSQGQEWDYVLFPFHKRFSIQLQRNLLYTALTRARRKVFIFGQYSALMRAVRNNRVEQRNTKFAKRLQDLLS